jgi:DNA primase large subunit
VSTANISFVSYRKGRRLEYVVRDMFRRRGWFVVRAAASKPVDLVCLKGGKTVLVECKYGVRGVRWVELAPLLEAARVERLLHGESDELLLHVINDLGLKVKKENGRWIMHFSQYLHLTKRLVTEPRWKLVNRLMDKGLVTLTRPEVIRLVREWLYDSFVQTKPLPVNWHPEEAKAIKEALQKRAAKTVAPAPSKEWAPCMVALRNRVADASHFGLFALAAYMAQKGYEVNEIVDVLRVRSDFDERIAKYQVEHIAGQRGSHVKYRPPSCQSMKTHGLCIEDGKHCPNNIKNPLQYTNRQTT